MALKIAKKTAQNVAPNYHQIVSLSVADLARTCDIDVFVWLDEPTRRDGTYQPVTSTRIHIEGAEFTALFGAGIPDYPSKAQLYSYLKTRPEYAGAQDV